MKELTQLIVEVGVFGDDDSHVVMIARVHEFGAIIEPKKGRYLTIPSSPKSKGKAARDFKDLYFIPTDNDNGLLARNKGRDEIEVLFVLVKSVTIPERSFMRSAFDDKENDLELNLGKLLWNVLDGKITPKGLYERIGQWMVMQIQEQIRKLDAPPNSKLTIESKKSSNPLIDTGRLIQSITYRIVKA